MNKFKKKLFTGLGIGALAVGALGGLAACASDADRVSDNISTESEQFRISRDIVFYNSITGAYIAEVKGRCSVDNQKELTDTLAVTCKVGDDQYTKDYFGPSDNTVWFMLQSTPVDVSTYSYEVILKPENVIPDLRVE